MPIDPPTSLPFHRPLSLLLLTSHRPPYQAQGSPHTSDPPLHNLMEQPSLKNLWWQLAGAFAAERTCRNDPVVRHGFHRRRNVVAETCIRAST
jgi:hypothetical protein